MRPDPSPALEGVICCRNIAEIHPRIEAGGPGVLTPGDILDGRFLITEVISRSGMAMIFRAEDLHRANADVALKVPHMEFESDPGFSERFRREEEIGLRLNHPYILKFIAITTPRSRPYIVTEYLKGCTLAHLLSAQAPIREDDALRIGELLCEALDHLHSNGVVHRDLKPHNVIVGCDGTIRLLDFGLASSVLHRRATFCGLTPAMGTPDYMAPEQVKGRRGDARTDIYSLGAMLYEMLAGRPPFDADSPLAAMNARVVGDPEPVRSLNPSVSRQAEEIVLHAMERNPCRRHATARALAAELRNPSAVPVTGRCDRLEDVSAVRVAIRRHLWTFLAFAVPAIVPASVAFWVFFLGSR